MRKNKRHYARDFERTIRRLDKNEDLLKYQENLQHEGTMPDKNPFGAKVKITTDEILGQNEHGTIFKTIYTESGWAMYQEFKKTYYELMNGEGNERNEGTDLNKDPESSG